MAPGDPKDAQGSTPLHPPERAPPEHGSREPRAMSAPVSSTPRGPGTRPGRRALRPAAQAVALLAVLLLAFFSTPLSRPESSYYSSADLSQGAVLTRTRAGSRPKNPLLSDPAVQMQPWLMFNRELLASGELPLWNDWNATGAPHLANYQSAVFSPFSLPFYVLGFRWALLVAAFARLFCLGLFAYLFFRALELRQLAALTGAVAFAFSGLNVLLLAYPHSAVAVTLPAGLWCVERAVRAREAWLARGGGPVLGPAPGSRRGTRWVLGLGLVLATGLLCGHPEPFCFALLVIAAYLVARLVSACARHRAVPGAAASLVGLALQLALAGVLAAGLAGVQVLPFLEYLAHSSTLGVRVMLPLELGNWPLAVFPDALGNPSTPMVMAYDLPSSNYEDVNTAYVGGLVLWLALVGAFVARSWRYLFFLGCILVGIVYGYDLLGLHERVGSNLILSAAPMRRSQVLGVFGLSACAALCVDRLAAGGRLRPRTALLAGGAAVALALVAWLGAERLFERALARGPTLAPEAELERFVTRHYLAIAGSLAAGALALLAGLGARAPARRLACGGLFVAALFFQTGFLLRDYNPTIDEEAFYPVTPSLQAVQREVGERRLLVLGENCLPPDINLAYDLRSAASYDALWVLPFDELYRALFDAHDNWRTAARVTQTGLTLCGVEYVLASTPWDTAGTEADGGDPNRSGREWLALPPGRTVSQTFIAQQDRLQGVELMVSRSSAAQARSLRVVLEDLGSGTKVAASFLEVPGHPALPGDPPGAIVESGVSFRFAPIAGSAGRTYRLSVRAARGPADDALAVAALLPEAVQAGIPGETYAIDGERTTGRLWFNRSYASDPFEAVLRLPPYTLWRYTRSPGRFYSVDRAEVVETDAEALERIQAPGFDPARMVLLASAPAEPPRRVRDPGPALPATVLADTHTHTRLRVERTRPGYLMISRAHYPGWSARVDGVEQELLRANVGLSAVQVPAGTSEVELRYRPRSFALGLWSSGLCALAFLAWSALAAFRAPPAPPSPRLRAGPAPRALEPPAEPAPELDSPPVQPPVPGRE